MDERTCVALESLPEGKSHLNFLDAIEFLYLPLLTQEAAVMVSAFTYGLRAGVSPWLLLGTNATAIVTDVAIIFVPAYVLSGRRRTPVPGRFQRMHERAVGFADRLGTFRAAVVAAFILPSVTAMLVLGIMRLPFRRTLAGIVVGSFAYSLIPLLVAAPVAPIVPRPFISFLPWIAPALAVAVILATLARARFAR